MDLTKKWHRSEFVSHEMLEWKLFSFRILSEQEV